MCRTLNVLLFCFLLVSCHLKKEDKKPNFTDWYASKTSTKTGEFDSSKIRRFNLSSGLFDIDTIYRSMMGELVDKNFQLADSTELLWLIGYKLKLYNRNRTSEVSTDFVCHNNLNLALKRNFPWDAGVFTYDNRIFTLTPGFTELTLPRGFGIPIPGNQELISSFQVLNHNIPIIDTAIEHEITLYYMLDSEIDFPMKALGMHTVWMFKQYEGPPGYYGEAPPSTWKDTLEDGHDYHPAQQPSCGVDMLANNPIEKLDLYWDVHGRKFTGHWKIPPGKELLRFETTKMLNFKEDKKLYYASGHVHPFCEYLELRDVTDNKLIFKSDVESHRDKIGLKKIGDFVSEEGVLLKKNHQYEMVSAYNNTSGDTLSAMSVLYLYMEQ